MPHHDDKNGAEISTHADIVLITMMQLDFLAHHDVSQKEWDTVGRIVEAVIEYTAIQTRKEIFAAPPSSN